MRDVVGYEGEIIWNREIPDGTFRKLLDVTKLHKLGWKHQRTLQEGLKETYEWFQQNYERSRLNVHVSKTF